MNKADYISFYDERRGQGYQRIRPEQHNHYQGLKTLIEKYSLKDKKCLEIGSSGGYFQDMVEDYSGTDISNALAQYYHKTYRVAAGERYPFEDQAFDAIWTISVFEHIPPLQQALLEIDRLLKPGGILIFAPAWQCRPWAAGGYTVRPYQDLELKEKLIKASIPIRNSVIWRGLFILPKRLFRQARFLVGHHCAEIHYKRLTPNYDIYWTSDSDACNHIDPHDAILWFASHGFDCLSHPFHWRAFLVRSKFLVFKKRYPY